MNQEDMPLVTAVIPIYNHEKYVIESIRSILGQTYRNVELIIINDGSTDHSHEMVLTLTEECKRRFRRFEYINRDNIGLTATLNQALSMASGKYFSAMASDDIALPDKFAVLVDALESTDENYAAAFGNAFLIDDQANRLSLSFSGKGSQVETDTFYENYLDFRTAGGTFFAYRSKEFGLYHTLLSHNYLPAVSCMVNTHLIRQVGAWTNGNLSEDWELWRKLSKQHRLLYVDRPLALYRWHESNSVKVSSHTLKLHSLLLLMKEKQYCASSDLMPLWRNAYISLLLPVLADNRIPLRTKLSALDVSIPMCLSVSKRLVRKVLKVVNKKKKKNLQ